jgi:predicted transcriptional regulator
MSNTLTIRIPDDLAQWLDETARKAGVPKGRIIREELERARKSEGRPFMRLAGVIDGPVNLSSRKGFSRK